MVYEHNYRNFIRPIGKRRNYLAISQCSVCYGLP